MSEDEHMFTKPTPPKTYDSPTTYLIYWAACDVGGCIPSLSHSHFYDI